MTFEEWIRTGIANKWISPPVCGMHEGVPVTAEEEYELDEGNDPCHTVVRVFYDPDDYDEAVANNPLVWTAWQVPRLHP